MAKFGEEWQFPYAFAAIDGSHLPIKCPRGGAKARKQYFNFKGFYSIILLALVDAQYRFIWASVGAPGNTHDSTLFQSTRLWKQISDGKIVPNLVQQVKDVEVPPLNSWRWCLSFTPLDHEASWGCCAFEGETLF